jgi:hypothetical protein
MIAIWAEARVVCIMWSRTDCETLGWGTQPSVSCMRPRAGRAGSLLPLLTPTSTSDSGRTLIALSSARGGAQNPGGDVCGWNPEA